MQAALQCNAYMSCECTSSGVCGPWPLLDTDCHVDVASVAWTLWLKLSHYFWLLNSEMFAMAVSTPIACYTCRYAYLFKAWLMLHLFRTLDLLLW